MTLGQTLSNAQGVDGAAHGSGDTAEGEFDLQLALQPAMGPGSTLWREHPDGTWSTLTGASAWNS